MMVGKKRDLQAPGQANGANSYGCRPALVRQASNEDTGARHAADATPDLNCGHEDEAHGGGHEIQHHLLVPIDRLSTIRHRPWPCRKNAVCTRRSKNVSESGPWSRRQW